MSTEETKQPLGTPSKQEKFDTTSLEGIMNRISDDFKDVTPLSKLSQLSGMNPGHLILSIIIGAFFLTIIGSGTFIVNLIVGMLYPGFMTIKVMGSKDQSQTKQWLSYWILFLLTFLLDKLVMIVFHHFAAIYHPVKTMFLIWLYYPRTQGAKIIYEKFLMESLNQFDLIPKLQQQFKAE